MASCTVSFRIKLFIHVALVNILMTIEALDANLPEVPFFSFLMTANTRRCQVRPIKPELALVMLIDGK